ncbi:protein NO VEIN domain-containing protein [Variovorax sp. ZT4R33]|uniref:protein NO VEIN domain-containing protein n=1 Tax=Variovorax sp. ZT4R33 TaxID=3443743 RepID=UPI003F477744
MEKEVDPQVLKVIDEKRLSGPRLTPVEIVAKMGVFDAREKPFDYAWLATGDIVITTVWAEYLSVGAGGRWFMLESLDTQRRAGGGARNANQTQRAKDRLDLLKRTFDAGQGFRAVLQTNRIAIAEVESSKNSKVSTRVRDDDEWHVALWEPDHKLAVLVRGPRGWVPTDEELAAARTRGSLPDDGVPATALSEQASPDDVHAAALGYVTRHFGGYGYQTKPLNAQDVGCDLEVLDKKGATLLKVAVKGTSGKVTRFRLTDEERTASAREPLWRMLVVSDALTAAPQHKIYKPTEVANAPGFEG